MNILFIALFSCTFLLLIAAIFLIWSWINQTPFYPSSGKKLRELLNSREIQLPIEINFIDIGSGDGRIVSQMADIAKRAEGIEYNPFLTLISRLRLFMKRSNTQIYNKDFFKHNYEKYNVAYMYIFNSQIDKLKDILIQQMPEGSVLITNTFKFSNINPDSQIGRFNIYYIKK